MLGGRRARGDRRCENLLWKAGDQSVPSTPCRPTKRPPATGTESKEDTRQLLEWSLEAALKLPPTSAYAKHRIACTRKAIQLLDSRRALVLRAFPCKLANSPDTVCVLDLQGTSTRSSQQARDHIDRPAQHDFKSHPFLQVYQRCGRARRAFEGLGPEMMHSAPRRGQLGSR